MALQLLGHAAPAALPVPPGRAPANGLIYSQMLRKALPWLKRAWMLIAIYIPTLYSLGSHHIDRLSIKTSCASTSVSGDVSATALDKC